MVELTPRLERRALVVLQIFYLAQPAQGIGGILFQSRLEGVPRSPVSVLRHQPPSGLGGRGGGAQGEAGRQQQGRQPGPTGVRDFRGL